MNPIARAPSRLLWLGAAIWLVAIGVGAGRLLASSLEPGAIDLAPDKWPSDSGIARSTHRPTLVVFLHPKCPCSRATLDELEALFPIAAAVEVMFLRPSEVEAGWEKTSLWQRVSALPGVRVHTDTSGAEAKRFGAKTSGHVVLYGADGTLSFSGGITGARGHSGDNPGRRALASALGGATSSSAPVFGCPIETPTESR
jgi:hypothetical protein